MPRYVLRPGKPQAVFVAAGALAIMTFGIFQMVRSGESSWFLVLWVATGLFVIVGALVQGFGHRGATTAAAETGDDQPRRVAVIGGRPMAVIGAVIGAGILVFGAIQTSRSGDMAHLVMWVAVGVAVITFNLWTAFSRKGGPYVERRDR